MLPCHLGKKEQAEPRPAWALWGGASFRVPFTQRRAVCLEGLEHPMTFQVLAPSLILPEDSTRPSVGGAEWSRREAHPLDLSLGRKRLRQAAWGCDLAPGTSPGSVVRCQSKPQDERPRRVSSLQPQAEAARAGLEGPHGPRPRPLFPVGTSQGTHSLSSPGRAQGRGVRPLRPPCRSQVPPAPSPMATESG